ncbi:MAG: hypothetical protein M1115_05345 [Actinobacteria bacterium]|nr:hypothetical protein [Actinomycetota bacterium]
MPPGGTGRRTAPQGSSQPGRWGGSDQDPLSRPPGTSQWSGQGAARARPRARHGSRSDHDPLAGLSRLQQRNRRRHRRARRLIAAASAFVVLCLLLAGGAFAYVSYRDSQIKRVKVGGLITSNTSQPENILLVGSNSRAVAGRAQRQAGSAVRYLQ